MNSAIWAHHNCHTFSICSLSHFNETGNLSRPVTFGELAAYHYTQVVYHGYIDACSAMRWYCVTPRSILNRWLQ